MWSYYTCTTFSKIILIIILTKISCNINLCLEITQKHVLTKHTKCTKPNVYVSGKISVALLNQLNLITNNNIYTGFILALQAHRVPLSCCLCDSWTDLFQFLPIVWTWVTSVSTEMCRLNWVSVLLRVVSYLTCSASNAKTVRVFLCKRAWPLSGQRSRSPARRWRRSRNENRHVSLDRLVSSFSSHWVCNISHLCLYFFHQGFPAA